MPEYEIAELLPNNARHGFSEFSIDVFNNLSGSEQDALKRLASSLQAQDGAIHLPVLEKLKRPVKGKKYRVRDGDRRIMATLCVLGRPKVEAIERTFTSGRAMTILATQEQHRELTAYDRLRVVHEAVQKHGVDRVSKEGGIAVASVRSYCSWWKGLGKGARDYCRKNAERLTINVIGKAVAKERRGNDRAQIAFLKQALGDVRKTEKKTEKKRRTFKVEKVGEVLTRVHAHVVEACADDRQRELVELAFQQIQTELAALLHPEKKAAKRKTKSNGA